MHAEASPTVLVGQVSSEAQGYIRNSMIDAEEEEDIRYHIAALAGDQREMEQLLQHKDQLTEWINYKVRPFLSTPLRLAVTGGNVACVSLLIELGAEIDADDIKGQTPLFVATAQGNIEIMELLLRAGANPMGSSRNRTIPILLAVRDGFAKGVKLLMTFGAKVDPTAEYLKFAQGVGGWCLQHSVVYAHFSCFLALIQSGASPHIRSLGTELKTIQRLSIPHTIAKYAKDFPEFVKLYHESGGDLLQKNVNGCIVLEETDHSSPAMKEFRLLAGQPISLKSSCRLRIRQIAGRFHLLKLNTLDIPETLKSFLGFEEFEKYAKKTVRNLHIKVVPRDAESKCLNQLIGDG